VLERHREPPRLETVRVAPPGPGEVRVRMRVAGLCHTDLTQVRDARFTPILACSDPGEAPLKSGLLVARLGNGYFVYTSLAWFRQLPEGVPGAYRLFANLVSLGK